METEGAPRPSKKLVIAGWVLSALPSAMLVFSAVLKFLKPPEFGDSMQHLGWDMNAATALGAVEIACTVVYLVPRTAVLGAVLLTGYLGGATATHARVHDVFIWPVLFGMVVWLGLYLRDARVRALLPLRRPA